MEQVCKKDFLDLDQITPKDLRLILETAKILRAEIKAGHFHEPVLRGQTLAMIFDKPSTRTRISFDVGFRQLGGETLMLSGEEVRLRGGESFHDIARVLSRFVDVIVMRVLEKDTLTDFARNATIPVINGLTYASHPCQVMADLLTLEDKKQSISGKIVTWSGPYNNVAASWIDAAVAFDFELRLAVPDTLEAFCVPEGKIKVAREKGARLHLVKDAKEAARGSDCIITDTWISMGDNHAVDPDNVLKPYQVNEALMLEAKPDAIFMHCMPAKRGFEVTPEVIDGPQSVVIDEAENRLHVQKGIIAWCLGVTNRL